MTGIIIAIYRKIGFRLTGKSRLSIHCVGAGAIAIALAVTPAYAAVGIQGTMSNFDVFNETGNPVYGAELDLEGILSSEVTKTYPSHFSSMTATDYAGGTRLLFTGYTFGLPAPDNYIIPTVGHSTNGHYAVNLPGCEHFGFSVAKQPTATKFYWLDKNSVTIGTTPLSIPTTTWTYAPPAVPGNPAVMQAVLAPIPPPAPLQYQDAVWVKTYVTELSRPADLNELISYDPSNIDPNNPSVAPQLPSEVEAEWELLPGDAPLPEPDIILAEADQSVIRRYEFYKYTGTYDEVHLPNYQFTGGPLPADAPLGDFIAANMVAVNLVVPEPSGLALILTGLGMSGWMVCRRRESKRGRI